ncbi:MAG: SUMF1/EgtB/PvdO family nonheme iron enzyme [Sphingobacteriia bacterium]|nr:SUMF1/EgtB/PvdO family nonheme iron enzyme [Sphingobacteriia bacterium]
MKRLLLFVLVAIIATSCSNSGNGELTGVPDRPNFYQPDPYGMVFIPLGSFTMGGGDQDVPYAQLAGPKVVSVTSFYMDETEITNNEYRQFVYWVRDSLAHTMLGRAKLAGSDSRAEHFVTNRDGEPIQYGLNQKYYKINWREDIDWAGRDLEEGNPNPLDSMYFPEEERFFRRKQLDTRKLFYRYYWIDMPRAAKIANRWQNSYDENGLMTGKDGQYPEEIQKEGNRRAFVKEDVINVYPDTLAWISDFTYSYNEPMTKTYFWHPAYDNYPVVGIDWKQAGAFSVWRTEYMNSYLSSKKGETLINDFRLPTETEWEWAARGGYELNPYPWGGPYPRNQNGCFLANFKTNRGNYSADGGIHTVVVGHYPPNDFGLYDMSGNVAEWTESAFDEVTYSIVWDLNPSFTYNAKHDDPAVLKRKVVRGGSWKDISYFLQVSSRSYEYQDSAKSWIGFRCVQSYLGRNKNDSPSKSSEVYK